MLSLKSQVKLRAPVIISENLGMSNDVWPQPAKRKPSISFLDIYLNAKSSKWWFDSFMGC